MKFKAILFILRLLHSFQLSCRKRGFESKTSMACRNRACGWINNTTSYGIYLILVWIQKICTLFVIQKFMLHSCATAISYRGRSGRRAAACCCDFVHAVSWSLLHIYIENAKDRRLLLAAFKGIHTSVAAAAGDIGRLNR